MRIPAPPAPWQRRFLIGTSAALALASGVLCGLSAAGAFRAAAAAPFILAITFGVLSLAALVPRRRTARGARIALAALAIALAAGGVFTHARLERKDRDTIKRSARAALVGRPAPPLHWSHAFNVPEGKRFPVRGRITLVDFWATWCAPCRRQMPELEALSRQSRGLDVVGITTFYGEDRSPAGQRAELGEIEAFLKTHGITYPVLVADDRSNLASFHVAGLPTLVLLDRAGNVIEYDVGSVGSQNVLARARAIATR